MINFLVGVPGSGKTYYAVNYIYNNYILKDTDSHLYTNIAMFKFDLSDKFYQFDFDNFYSSLEILFNMYSSNYSEDDLVLKAKELNIFKADFVIDEAHNFFDKDNKILIWFLTYHRHLYCNVFLITQNLLLIHYKYKYLAEFFIKSKNSSISFMSSKYFYYTFFSDDKLTEKVEVKKIKKDKKVFALYASADSVKSKNFFNKFFIYFIVLSFFTILGFFFLSHLFSSDSSLDSKNNSKNNSKDNSHFVSSSKNSNSYDHFDTIFIYSCFGSYCKIDDYYISASLLSTFDFIKFFYINSRIYLKSSKDLSKFLHLLPKTTSKGGYNASNIFNTFNAAK